MTPLGPPKLAPEGTPFSVARYLDNAAEYLRPIAEQDALDLKPYDIRQPDDGAWGHHLYGSAWDRGFAIQVVANDVGADSFNATVTAFVLHYAKGAKEVWLQIECRAVNGMAGLVACVHDFLAILRLACVWRMAHVTDPDSEA